MLYVKWLKQQIAEGERIRDSFATLEGNFSHTVTGWNARLRALGECLTRYQLGI